MKGFKEINILNNENKQLRKCFVFFLCIAICGYLSFMISFCPYADDHCRYVTNAGLGDVFAGRYFSFFIESVMYLSGVITDVAPFSQLLSCVFLAYCATICLKIFKINLNNKWEILCFVPVVINPYLSEVMMCRFDNPFITLSFLFAILSAYLSSFNYKGNFWYQFILFMLSSFTYQAGSFAYFSIFIYLFISEIRSGNNFVSAIRVMKYWICTLLLTLLIYLPCMQYITYSRGEDGILIIIPKDVESLKIIFTNICKYFSVFITDWSGNAVGQIVFVMAVIFVLDNLLRTYRKNKSLFSILIVFIGVFSLFLCPFGICVFLRYIAFEGCESFVRVLHSIGIVISLIFLENRRLFCRIKYCDKFFNAIICCLCVWCVVFLNSLSNIVRHFRIVQQHVSYDIAKDIHELTNANKNISKVCIKGAVSTPAITNFANLYPIVHRLIPGKWPAPDYCRIALMNSNLSEQFLKFATLGRKFIENSYKQKTKIKSSMWYDIFIFDNEVLLIKLKEDVKFKRPFDSMIKIRANKKNAIEGKHV